MVLTPLISVTVPTHHHETSGHSAIGRDFYELLVGGNATYKTFDIYVGYGGSVSGSNTLAVGGVAMGLSWRFSRGSDISKFPLKSRRATLPGLHF